MRRGNTSLEDTSPFLTVGRGRAQGLQLKEGTLLWIFAHNAADITENKLATQSVGKVPQALRGVLPHPLARNKSLVSNYTEIILNARQVKTKRK